MKKLLAGVDAFFSMIESADQSWSTRARAFEEVLVGLNLSDVVACLQATQDASQGLVECEAAATLEELLGEDLPALLEEGLTVNPESLCQRLWRNPHLLLTLQETIFTEGGAYWKTVPRSEEHQQRAQDGRAELMRKITEEG